MNCRVIKMNYLKIEEVKRRLDLLSSYELKADRYFEIIDEEIDGNKTIIDSMEQVYKRLLEQVSNEMKEMDKHMDLTPSCRLGCAFCCYFPIIITRLEAKMMIYSFEKMPINERDTIIKHLENYYLTYENLIKETTAIDIYSGDLKLNYVQKQLPCPLL